MSPIRVPSPRFAGARRVGLVPLVVAGTVIAVAATFGASPADAQTTNPGTTRPSASGMLSSISGSTLQVQEAAGNATVVVTPSTSYQQTKTAATTDIAAGACVRVMGTGSTSAGIQATTVALSKPPKGGCSATAQAGGRFRGGFRDGTRPNLPSGQRPNFPSGRPDLGPGGPGTDANGGSRPANFAIAFGAVKSISGDQMTMKAYTVSRPSSNSKSKPKVKTQTVKVTLASGTTVTQTTGATAKDLSVGACVNANGNVDSVGTITAQRVAISQPTNGACTGFGFGGGFGRRFGGGDQQSA
jgi:hypothetical protein